MKNYIEFPLWVIVATFLSLCLWQCKQANADVSIGDTTNIRHISIGSQTIQKRDIAVGSTVTATFALFSGRTDRYIASSGPTFLNLNLSGQTAQGSFSNGVTNFRIIYFIQGSNVTQYSIQICGYVGISISHLVVNGNEYAINAPSSTLSGPSSPATCSRGMFTVTNTADQVSATNLTNTYRIKFQDGTYAQFTKRVYTAPVAGPPITAFSVFPTSIDLDLRPSGTLTFTVGATGKTGNDLTCQSVRLPDGVNIGTTFSGVNGASISQNLPNIAQPSITTSYRLFCHYSGGGTSHRDTTVTVTKNAGISNCSFRSVAGGQSAPLGQTLHITCTITGTPRPVVTITGWNDGNAFTDRHFTSTGTNQWSFTASRFFGSVEARDVTVVATNSTFTARLVARYVP